MEYKMEWNNHCRKKTSTLTLFQRVIPPSHLKECMHDTYISLFCLWIWILSKQSEKNVFTCTILDYFQHKKTHTHININIMNTNKLRECGKNNKNLTTFATTGIMSRALWMFNRIRISILLCESFFLDLKNFTRNFFSHWFH
mgnify:CR=1 FL=1